MPRLVTPVRTQPPGDLRCISYAVAAAVETAICRARGSVDNVPEISVDDVFKQGGKEVGAIDGIKLAIQKGGVVDAVCCPPSALTRCADPATHLWKGRIRAIGGTQKTRVTLMRQELRERGPLVTILKAFENFAGFTGTGVYQATGKVVGFHALCIVGDEVDPTGTSGSWIAKNSFGTNWGDAGFGRFKWGDPNVNLENIVFVVEDVHQ